MEDFARLPEASRAGLNRAHILALRLATSSAFRRITGPLFVGCSDSRPHPYPATVAVLSEAITALQKKVREHLEAKQAKQRELDELRAEVFVVNEEMAATAARKWIKYTTGGGAAIAATRVKLDVPRAQKDFVKMLGAEWDNHSWGVPVGVSVRPFAFWLSGVVVAA